MRVGDTWSRRGFLTGLAGMGTAGFGTRPAAAEPPPETTTLRLDRASILCMAPIPVAEELLRAEGFTDVQFVESPDWSHLYSGQIQFGQEYGVREIVIIDEGKPILLLGGVHVGCLELFGTERVRSIRDLKGKRVAAGPIGHSRYLFLAAMAAHVGLDAKKDIEWVVLPRPESMQQLADDKVDAYVGTPPDPQELRAKKVGHVVVNSKLDRPWSQYFCCFLMANRDFVRRHPVATKRALRAILKATDLCASDPERVGDFLVARGHTTRRDYVLQALRDIPFKRWREFNSEDTVRFYALRLKEAGLIQSSPQKILAQGTDWRFFNELKRELKG